MLLPIRGGDVRLVWVFSVYTLDTQHVYDMTVDAADGQVWTRFDQVAADSYRVYAPPGGEPEPRRAAAARRRAHARDQPRETPTRLALRLARHQRRRRAPSSPPPRATTSTPTPTRTPTTSPTPGSSPTAAPASSSTSRSTSPRRPSAYRPAAVTNLFYWNNLIHDIQYQYGFDEAAGNFQVNNYGRGGAGQRRRPGRGPGRRGTNNANFFTPPDGQRPADADVPVDRRPTPTATATSTTASSSTSTATASRTAWWAAPQRELPHQHPAARARGSPTGGPSPTPARSGDTGTDAPRHRDLRPGPAHRPARGIRTQRYSTDPAINTWTYASINGMADPPRRGLGLGAGGLGGLLEAGGRPRLRHRPLQRHRQRRQPAGHGCTSTRA